MPAVDSNGGYIFHVSSCISSYRYGNMQTEAGPWSRTKQNKNNEDGRDPEPNLVSQVEYRSDGPIAMGWLQIQILCLT